MKVLSRNWKTKVSRSYELQSLGWEESHLIVDFTSIGSQESISIIGKLRGSIHNIIKPINVQKLQKNNGLWYRAIFNIEEFGNNLNSVWDFYTVDESSKEYRVKSYIALNKKLPYKLPKSSMILKAYSTVQNNLSIKIEKSNTLLDVNDIDFKEDSLYISANLFIHKEYKSIFILSNDEEYISKYGNINVIGRENNYINIHLDIEYPLDKILCLSGEKKAQLLRFNLKFDDETEEYINIKAPNNFIKTSKVKDNNTISIYNDKSENLYIRIQENGAKAQVTSIFSYDDKFEINGFLDYESFNKKQSADLLIEKRQGKEFIILPLKINKNKKFTAQIKLNQLLNNNMLDGVWDIYFVSNDVKLRLESSLDDVENKQQVVQIPQRIRGNRYDTYVYKLYYTLENEVSLIIRKYMTIKRISKGCISSDKLLLEGDFFVEPPVQSLPENLQGTLNITGYYNRRYSLDSRIETSPTKNKYYTHFILESDISHLSNEEKRTIKSDLLCNTINLEMKVNQYQVSLTGVVDGKGLTEEMNIFNKYIKYKRTKNFAKLYKLFNKVILIDKNLAVYQSFHGKSYSCSPKAIHEELLRTKKDYKGVWVLENEYTDVPKGTIVVKPNTIRYYYYLAKAKYFINNGNFPDFYEKRQGTIHLQTWHGTPLKRLGYDISPDSPSYQENNSPELIRRNKRWDYLIGPNQYTSEILQRAFGFNNKMLDVGYPRNDVLYKHKNTDRVNEIKKKLGIDEDKKIVLYAPTWRDSDFHGGQSNQPYKLKFDIEQFKKEFSDTHVLLLRLHYRDASRLSISLSDKTIINASFYDDIQELYLIADTLITDYSSVMFDYANLKRPMIFYCYDYLKYKGEMRGCYFNFASVAPGPIVFDEKQLFESITCSDTFTEIYSKEIEQFYNKFCSWEDGNATSRVIKEVFEY